MLSKKIEAAINNQINHEMAAAYNYLAMSAWFEQENLPGFARWMMIQREEELEHALRLYNYLLDRGGTVDLAAVNKPKAKYKSVLDAFKVAMKQEQSNTAAINGLYKLAKAEDDFATLSHLQWFLDEQVEEEKIMDESISMIELAGDDSSAMLMLNEKFGSRAPEDG